MNCPGVKMKILVLVSALSSVLWAVRPFPNTQNGIYVFNDQLAGWMTDDQFRFAATHYAGCQKMLRSDADRLRSYNPNFIILHYRLGLGLGYRAVVGGEPTGEWLQIIEDNDWVQEWPGDAVVKDEWFFHWSGQRVLNLDWGWFVMELNNSNWRNWWIGEIKRQLAANDNDGLFADSYSVPNYMGGDRFDPALPDVDAGFEQTWADRIHGFTDFIHGQFGAGYKFIPNVGNWVTGRDPTDYSNVDGVMVEGFSEWEPENPYELADWQLQMNRILSLSALNKIIICQSYIYDPTDIATRDYYLANYLLIKGNYTYINMDYGEDPEYFPEYNLKIGSPADPLPASIDGLFNSTWGVYVRHYSNGMVLVNPDADSKSINLGQTLHLATPDGGGIVPENGDISSWKIQYQPVTQLNLPAYSGAVLLSSLGIKENANCKVQTAKLENIPTIISSRFIEYLNTGVPKGDFKIYDSNGRLIAAHALRGGLKPGIYFIEFKTENHRTVKKVVIL
jgi:hypothetical protein